MYVIEKIDADKLPPGQLIPKEINGIKTDVNIVRSKIKPSEDSTLHRPITGGIQISNGREMPIGLDAIGFGKGTLGCIAVDNLDGRPVLVSNWHVLMTEGGLAGAKIHQPFSPDNENGTLETSPQNNVNAIAEIIRVAINEKADVGIAKIIESYSGCKCSGIPYLNTIRGLNLNGYDGIAGVARAVPGEHVFKVGKTTDRTEGIVVTDNEAPFNISYAPHIVRTQTFSGQITIRPLPGVLKFSDEGDSGAVIVNSNSEIVGLHFASDTEPTIERDHSAAFFYSSANHIADIMNAATGVNIRFNFTPRPTTPSSGAVLEMSKPQISNISETTFEKLKALFDQHPSSRQLVKLAEQHRFELLELVNHCRPVMVTWQRGRGPAFFNYFLNNVQEPANLIPLTVKGCAFHELLSNMAQVLLQHGSLPLQKDIHLLAVSLVAAAKDCRSATDFITKFNQLV